MTDLGHVTCITCGKSGHPADKAVWHPFHHPVRTADDQDVPNIFKKQGPSPERQSDAGPQVSVLQSSMPFDPVLRQALIDKGVLTPDDLREAEKKIFAITGMMTQGVQDVPSTHDRGGPHV